MWSHNVWITGITATYLPSPGNSVLPKENTDDKESLLYNLRVCIYSHVFSVLMKYWKDTGKKSECVFLFICWPNLLVFFRRVVLCKTDVSKENRIAWFECLMVHFRVKKNLMKCCFKKIKKRDTNEPCTVNNCSSKVKEVSNNSVLLTKLNTSSLLCKRPSV